MNLFRYVVNHIRNHSTLEVIKSDEYMDKMNKTIKTLGESKYHIQSMIVEKMNTQDQLDPTGKDLSFIVRSLVI